MKRALPVLAALALIACQPAADTDAQGEAPTAPASPTTETAQSGAAATQIIALDAEGLRLVDEATGNTRLLAFGAPKDEANTAIAALAGAATDAGEMSECGPGPLTYTEYGNGLRLWFNQGTFTGWESTGELTTMDGLSAEANRAEVEAAGVTEFTRDTLEDEFEHNGVFGVMEDGGQDVALLHVGDNCFMR